MIDESEHILNNVEKVEPVKVVILTRISGIGFKSMPKTITALPQVSLK